jgi:hypothetical protein
VGRGLGMGERRRGGALASDSGRGGQRSSALRPSWASMGGGGVGTSGAKAWAQGRATSDGCR